MARMNQAFPATLASQEGRMVSAADSVMPNSRNHREWNIPLCDRAVCVPFSMPTSSNPSLLVVRPEPQHLHCFLFLENLVDQSVLDVDSSRVGPCQITY